MPGLNWDAFAKLPGGGEKNFELLCRGAVRHTFGSYGIIRALANQPGVEFHLKLDRHCDALGHPGRWWGWQCKWYKLPASGTLGSTRRTEIKEAIRNTEAHVSGVTDWVLWTRRPLTKADQNWFRGISSTMALQLWTEDEIDNLLVGQAAVFRSTYFGELVLTPDVLREQHEQATAPIRARWRPEVHHVVDAECELRRMLGEADTWENLRALAAGLRSMVQLAEDAPAVPTAIAAFVGNISETSRQSAAALERVADRIRDGDLDLLSDELTARPRVVPADFAKTLGWLRSGNHRAGLYLTNAVAGCHEGLDLFTAVEAALSSRVIAVLAPAGCGKTHLAAQLTAGTEARPHGVLLHGGDLHASHTLDDLARRVSIAAQPVQSIESLLAALDAAGQRARHRLPVVIDGLNESEDPRAWKPLLASLEPMLAKYPYVLFVCTVRPEFAGEALPDSTQRVKVDGYGDETSDAVREHFRHYKIDATDTSIPIGLLRHPLTLRLFCEVTNSKREKMVGLDAMPGSLTALFDSYLDQAGDRIAELAPVTHRYLAQDVREALTVIGDRLWDSRTRSLEGYELRHALKDEGRLWNHSLVRALDQEGVLLRMPSSGSGSYAPVYDLLGGHIIATALLAKHGHVGFEALIREPDTSTLLGGNSNERHPLAEDIVYSLVGQIPRRFHSKQLWQMVGEPLRSRALRFAARLETAYLDMATVEALLDLARQGDAGILDQLWEARGIQNHPLNAEALDRVLRRMGVAERDLTWTEWLRRRQIEILRDLRRIEDRWRHDGLHAGDRLRARWVVWALTSTVRRLRDQATRALYWFGRVDPEGLFEIAVDALAVNDAYVGERMLAATYGVVMSHQQAGADFEVHLVPLLDRLADALMGPAATAPTCHYLARLYARGIIAFAAKFYTSALPKRLRSKAWKFGMPGLTTPIGKTDRRAEELRRTLQMDFENYTLGRLFEDRSNYDFDHKAHQAAVAHVLGVVWSLGWRAEKFETLDDTIAGDAFRDESRGNRPRAERYGKKYGWIGFFTYAGLLESQGLLPRRDRPFSDVDIDPSFCDQPPVDGAVTIPLAWLAPSIKIHEHWVRRSPTSVPRTLIVRQRIGEHDGPWVAVHGSVAAEDRVLGRKAWAFISALVAPKRSTPRLVAALKAGKRPWLSRDAPSDYYTFAGEIPWHPSFAAEIFAGDGPERAYREEIGNGAGKVQIEVLAHKFVWESYHSEMNYSGSVRVPSRCFSDRFGLRSAPQGFDQFLPDGTRATITLRGVDGLEGDILYVRENLLRKYVCGRAIVWFAFGGRELRPYPPSPPAWLVDVQRQESNGWHEVLTETDIEQWRKKVRTKGTANKKAGARKKAITRGRGRASEKKD